MRSVSIKRENRYDMHGEICLMCECDGYCMVRRPHAVPFCVSRADWDRLPDNLHGADDWRVAHGRVTRAAQLQDDFR